MQGPSEKGKLFVVLEYMKGGQTVTPLCPPPFVVFEMLAKK